MDFGLAFSYPFQDKDWIQKILLTGVISLIPIVGQIAVLGWLIEITARVIRGESDPMPKWEDFGGLFMSGLKAFALGFIFGLPLMIIAFPAAIIDMLVDSESAAVVFSLLLACLSCLSIIYGLALAFIIPAAYICRILPGWIWRDPLLRGRPLHGRLCICRRSAPLRSSLPAGHLGELARRDALFGHTRQRLPRQGQPCFSRGRSAVRPRTHRIFLLACVLFQRQVGALRHLPNIRCRRHDDRHD